MANSNGWGDGAANNAIGWGQGANNAIGWGDSHKKSWAGLTDIVAITTDADAQAFITAAAITDTTQQTAINNLVVGMKADGTWTKMKAIYPFVGGTASAHKYNLKDPRDLDAAFRLVFNGGWTHSSTGATPNGTNGYADTFLTPSTTLGLNSSSHGYYSRTNIMLGNSIDMGTAIGAIGAGNKSYVIFKFATLSYIAVNNILDYQINSIADTRGLLVSNRPNSTQLKAHLNATTQTLTASSTGLSTLPFYIGSYNRAGTADNFSARQCAFSFIGDGLTDTEAAALYTAVQNMQIALSRNV